MPKLDFNYMIAAMAIVLILAVLIQLDEQKTAACTMDAKICSDGSAVGRMGPDCRFAPCPGSCSCPEGYVQDGDVCNPECYYGNPRCLAPSISCTATCNSDSDCVPEQCCHPTSCMNKDYKGACNLACTMSCETPLDCGGASCECLDNRCVVMQK
jgi:hypothetical protein